MAKHLFAGGGGCLGSSKSKIIALCLIGILSQTQFCDPKPEIP